ncbi:MAG: bifunctional DNA-formamidopyrimidine glycosylase/DNA-(apurinic or apyrimidinic site) lyase [SAR324 cluster bacterium]|nr:bifunctional DNA-formamidopyrimidine glycosylase/DNA-(apurinic or apyrimidinic site) lyase [SAR324 cluster bacterium]
MPELPEVETIRKDLAHHIVGQTIEQLIFLRSNIFTRELNDFKRLLTNKKITSVNRRAKLLLFMVDDLSLVTHLRMTGVYIFEKKNKSNSQITQKHTRFIISFNSGDKLIYQDQRALGKIYLFDEEMKQNFFIKYGVEPLESSFTINKLTSLLSKRRINIKQFLLDQRAVVGIGNIYASEILFLSKINPITPANQLKKSQIRNLKKSILIILKSALAHQGTTISDYRKADGESGNFQKFLKVYGHEKEPCPNCKEEIKRMSSYARSTFYCPRCQI